MNIICKGNFLNLDEPIVMGILNVTPDSFFDGGKYLNEEKIIERVTKMLNEGANMIDVGGYSTRPYAKEVSEKEELKRVLPTVKLISKNFKNAIISIDTFRSKIAEKCIANGATIINDISGGSFDSEMFRQVANINTPYILTHIQGTLETMQNQPNYKNIIEEIYIYFCRKIEMLNKLAFDNIIIDPGFGFGKTVEQNYQILQNLDKFRTLNKPILVGLSRKSMINKVLNISSTQALNGTSVLNTVALIKGANILRVHDVKEAKECIILTQQLKN